jgi:hypothetical protein
MAWLEKDSFYVVFHAWQATLWACMFDSNSMIEHKLTNLFTLVLFRRCDRSHVLVHRARRHPVRHHAPLRHRILRRVRHLLGRDLPRRRPRLRRLRRFPRSLWSAVPPASARDVRRAAGRQKISRKQFDADPAADSGVVGIVFVDVAAEFQEHAGQCRDRRRRGVKYNNK